MIQAVLLDLDDTLITTHTNEFFPRYLKLLARYAADYAPNGDFLEILLPAFERTLNEYRPTATLHERLLERLAAQAGQVIPETAAFFAAFYADRYAELRELGYVQPRQETPGLLRWLTDHSLCHVVATNPGLPRSAIVQRMRWGGIEPDDYPFTFITAAEEMHFGKPHAEYYAEVALRLGVKPCEAIMVGDDWESDIVGAVAAGLNAFWISPECVEPPDPSIAISGYGTYTQFVERLQAGWLDTLEWYGADCGALIHRLAAFPAVVDTTIRGHSGTVLECMPDEGEWSARDIICHLRDHELVDRERLERVLTEDNPFFSANQKSWANSESYQSVDAVSALAQFAQRRKLLVDWLRSLNEQVWDRPARDAIFGPTTFSEVVRFVVEHDRTHLQQIRSAIEAGLVSCGAG